LKDYSGFFTNVVAEHLHKLVDLVRDSHSQKVLVHEWVLGIEYNWKDYAGENKRRVYEPNPAGDSDFIPRLSFWISGLRDKFNSNPTKIQVIDLLYQTFDASTYCYFEYGTRDDVENQIEKYCEEVDDWFGEPILNPKLKKFRLSRKAIPAMNVAIKKLQEYGFAEDSELVISKNMENASDIEKDFMLRFKKISQAFIDQMNKNMDKFLEIQKDLDLFISECQSLGYSDILSKKHKLDINAVKQRSELKKLVMNSEAIYSDTFKINTNELIQLINKDISFSKIQQEIRSLLSGQLVDSLRKDTFKFDKMHQVLNSLNKLWKDNSFELFEEKQLTEIEDIAILIKRKDTLKTTIYDCFKELRKFDPTLPEPDKQGILTDVITPELNVIEENKILKYLYSIYIDILKRNPDLGNEIIKKIELFIRTVASNFSVKYFDYEFNKIKDKSYLKVMVVNIFRMPKKGIEVIIKQNSKTTDNKLTDKNGEVIFESVPKGKLVVSLNKNNKKREYPINIEQYYNEKKIWLFSF